MKRIAVYGGSFDPFTLGHEDLTKRALKIFDQVFIVIGKHFIKKGLFDPQERKDLIIGALGEAGMSNANVAIDILEPGNLLVDFAKKTKAIALVRSSRTTTDFEQEIVMGHHNRRQDGEIETIFMLPEFHFLSSSAVREIAICEGRLDYMVRHCVEKALREKFRRD